MLGHIERETMNIFLTSIQSIVPIIVIIILGYFLQVRGWFQESFGNDLSKLIMNVAMPVAIFTSVLKYLTLDKLISLSGGLLYTFIAFILGYLMAFIAVKLFRVRPGRRGTMINTFVNANTIFIGLPLNIALFGNQALPSAFIGISRSPRIFSAPSSCPKFCGKYLDLYW